MYYVTGKSSKVNVTEALTTAVYPGNRSATKSLDEMTPIEAWSKKKLYVGYLRMIGSKAIILIKDENRGKLQPKSDECMLVRYSAESKAYRLWKPGSKIIIKARDVKIFEDTDCKDELSKETLYVPYLNIDNIEMKDNHELSTKDDGEVVDEGDAECSDPDEKTIIQTRSQEKSRPALLKTGKPDQGRFISQVMRLHVRIRSLRVRSCGIMERNDAEL